MKSKSISYRPDIDGLRAIAVLAVVIFHVGSWLPGGFVGVDIFFVISGFLITGILDREVRENRFSLLRFYERRVRRIMPALAFMIICVLLVGWWMSLPFEYERMANHLTYVSVFASNYWTMAREGGYWVPQSDEIPLLHTWSLAVEEQFYIFMPILIWAVFRFASKWIVHVLSMLFLVSLAFSIWKSHESPKEAFYLLTSRSWELLIGSLAFYATRSNRLKFSRGVCESLNVLGLVLMGISFVWFTGSMIFPGYIALVPTTGCALVLFANAHNQTLSARFLAWKPLVFIGLISYSLYLIHWPLIYFTRSYLYPSDPTIIAQIGMILGSVLLSIMSWRFVEQPFRDKQLEKIPKRVVLTGFAMAMVFLTTSLLIRKWDGVPERFSGRYTLALVRVAQSDAQDRNGSNQFQSARKFEHGGIQQDVPEGATPDVVVIGDSHGAMIAPAISSAARKTRNSVAFFTHDGVAPLFGKKEKTNQKVRHFVETWKPGIVIVCLRLDNKKLSDLEEELVWLCQQSGQVYFLLQVPRISDENQRAAKLVFNRAKANGGRLPELHESEAGRSHRTRVKQYVKELSLPNLNVIDLSSEFLDGDQIRYHRNGYLLYRDDDHLNVRGAMQLENRILGILRKDRQPTFWPEVAKFKQFFLLPVFGQSTRIQVPTAQNSKARLR